MSANDLWPTDANWDLSYVDPVFGRIIGGGSVKQALILALQKWLPTYVAAVNRHLGADVLAPPKDYLYKFDERPIAAGTSQLAVMVPKTSDKPTRTESTTRATWAATVAVAFAGTQDWNESEAIAWAYEAAVRGAVIQHPDLEGLAETTKWVSSSLGPREERSSTFWRVTSLSTYDVTLPDVVTPFGGPPAPSVLTPAPPATVQTETIIVNRLD